MKNKFERIVKITPAFDKRDIDPKKNFGIGSMIIYFLLKGKKGIVQFAVMTNLHLPEVTDEFEKLGKKLNISPSIFEKNFNGWFPFDLGYHSTKPHYKRNKRLKCEYMDSGYCYYSGSSLAAQVPMEILVKEGSDGLWEFLEKRYKNFFD